MTISEPTSFNAVIALWPSITTLASDVGRTYQTVNSWKARNSIPPSDWEKLVAAAKSRGIENLSADLLFDLWLKRRREKVAAE